MGKIKTALLYLWDKSLGISDKNRVVTNIFDYNNVIRRRPDIDRPFRNSNCFYGFNYCLKRFSGFRGTINAVVEHAPALDGYIGDYGDKLAPSVVVNSEQRREFLRAKIEKSIFTVGPSIYYAKNIYTEFSLKIIKKNLGKTLLIYPLHDIENFSYIQDTQSFIEYVKKIKDENNYDTILVSLYFVDIERGRHIIYEKQGWTILSAGRRENYDFGDCMKTIISLADYAVFQAYASAIGYCIYEGVPVSIFPQEFRFVENGREGVQTDNGIRNETMRLFETMFQQYDESISKEKYEFCKYWYGYDSVMQADQLKLLFEYLKKTKIGMSKRKLRKIAFQKRFCGIREQLIRGIGE